MTLERARELIGRTVLYCGGRVDEQDTGVITSVNDTYVFVRYGTDSRSIATRPQDIRHPIADCRDCGRKYWQANESEICTMCAGEAAMNEPMCKECSVRYYPVTDDPGICPRCRPLWQTTGPDWLPEKYEIRLTSFEVGILLGLAIERLSVEQDAREATVPGVLRLLRKLDDLAKQVYGDAREARS